MALTRGDGALPRPGCRAAPPRCPCTGVCGSVITEGVLLKSGAPRPERSLGAALNVSTCDLGGPEARWGVWCLVERLAGECGIQKVRASGEAGGLLLLQRRPLGESGLGTRGCSRGTTGRRRPPAEAQLLSPLSAAEPGAAPGWSGAPSGPSGPQPSEGVWWPPVSREGPWGVRVGLPVLCYLRVPLSLTLCVPFPVSALRPVSVVSIVPPLRAGLRLSGPGPLRISLMSVWLHGREPGHCFDVGSLMPLRTAVPFYEIQMTRARRARRLLSEALLREAEHAASCSSGGQRGASCLGL